MAAIKINGFDAATIASMAAKFKAEHAFEGDGKLTDDQRVKQAETKYGPTVRAVCYNVCLPLAGHSTDDSTGLNALCFTAVDSVVQAVSENGKPLLDAKGNPVRIPSGERGAVSLLVARTVLSMGTRAMSDDGQRAKRGKGARFTVTADGLGKVAEQIEADEGK